MISIKKCWGSQLGPRNQVGINWAQTFSNQSFYQGRHICKSIVSWLHFVISVENWYFVPTWSDPNFAIFGNSVWSDMWGGFSSASPFTRQTFSSFLSRNILDFFLKMLDFLLIFCGNSVWSDIWARLLLLGRLSPKISLHCSPTPHIKPLSDICPICLLSICDICQHFNHSDICPICLFSICGFVKILTTLTFVLSRFVVLSKF